MQKKYIFLIEHPKRELEFVKRICDELKNKRQITYIYSIHFDLWKINRHKSCVIFLPYCLADNDYPFSAISKRKGHVFVNMNWEQILSPINKSVKIISGEARNNLQLCWNPDFREHLIKKCKINSEKIISSVNPTSFLMRDVKVNKKFQEYCSQKKITNYIFFPLNYNWALMEESRRKKRIQSLGYDNQLARKYINYSEYHLDKFLKFIHEILSSTDFTLILRPHPGISVEAYVDKIQASKFTEIIKNQRFIIENSFSAIDWIKNAELTISNWSTLIYDLWVAGYNGCYFWPEDIPNFIDAYHTKEPPKIRNVVDLKNNFENNFENSFDQNFDSFISSILKINQVLSEGKIKNPFFLASRLKTIRSLIRYLFLKLKFKKLVDPIVLIDHFEID